MGADAVWNVLAAGGGTLALVLIVTIAVGINALTLLFLGSAVVTLERFARVARSAKSLLGFSACWSVLVGAGSLYWADPELVAAAGRGRAFGLATAGSAVAIAVAVVLVELLAIAWIRHRFMDTPLLLAVFQVVIGGLLVFFAGILIGSS